MQTPAPFEYERATSLQGAIASLREHEDSRIIAGGHSLLPMMKLRLASPTRLIDINDLTDLYRPYPVLESDGGQYRCGAASAVVDGQTVRVTRDPGDLDAWRAACSAWWAANPETAAALAPVLVWLDH